MKTKETSLNKSRCKRNDSLLPRQGETGGGTDCRPACQLHLLPHCILPTLLTFNAHHTPARQGAQMLGLHSRDGISSHNGYNISCRVHQIKWTSGTAQHFKQAPIQTEGSRWQRCSGCALVISFSHQTRDISSSCIRSLPILILQHPGSNLGSASLPPVL